jgi:hypothetical protein
MCAETTKSENVRTEGMRADVTVEARPDGKTHVDVTLRAGGTFSNLFPAPSPGDRLEITNGAETAPLAFGTHLIARPSWYATLPGDSSGKTIELRFHRTGNTSALGTRVTMPPSLTITSPPAGERFSPAKSALVLTWAPTATVPMQWSVDGACIEGRHGDVPSDTGRLEISLTAAPPPDGGAARARCDVTAKLERSAHGVVDPAFGEGGSISATVRRETVVEFAP